MPLLPFSSDYCSSCSSTTTVDAALPQQRLFDLWMCPTPMVTSLRYLILYFCFQGSARFTVWWQVWRSVVRQSGCLVELLLRVLLHD